MKDGKQSKANTSKSDQRSKNPRRCQYLLIAFTLPVKVLRKQGKAETSKIASKPKPKMSKSPVLIDCTTTYSNKHWPSSSGSLTPPSRKPASRDKENATDSGPTESVPDSNASRNYQCEHCRLQDSRRNCLYRHKMKKHTAENAKKVVQSKDLVFPDCKKDESK